MGRVSVLQDEKDLEVCFITMNTTEMAEMITFTLLFFLTTLNIPLIRKKKIIISALPPLQACLSIYIYYGEEEF